MTNWYKIAQDAPPGGGAPPPPPPPPPPMGGGMPPPPGGAPAGPSEQRVGTLSGVREEEINDEKTDDRKKLDKMNKAFRNALDGGHDIIDSAAMAIMATGSSVSPHQLDIAETFDPDFPDKEPPFIRKILGLELGNKQQPPGGAPGGAEASPPPPPPPMG